MSEYLRERNRQKGKKVKKDAMLNIYELVYGSTRHYLTNISCSIFLTA